MACRAQSQLPDVIAARWAVSGGPTRLAVTGCGPPTPRSRAPSAALPAEPLYHQTMCLGQLCSLFYVPAINNFALQASMRSAPSTITGTAPSLRLRALRWRFGTTSAASRCTASAGAQTPSRQVRSGGEQSDRHNMPEQVLAVQAHVHLPSCSACLHTALAHSPQPAQSCTPPTRALHPHPACPPFQCGSTPLSPMCLPPRAATEASRCTTCAATRPSASWSCRRVACCAHCAVWLAAASVVMCTCARLSP